jgi:hypothetical protein
MSYSTKLESRTSEQDSKPSKAVQHITRKSVETKHLDSIRSSQESLRGTAKTLTQTTSSSGLRSSYQHSPRRLTQQQLLDEQSRLEAQLVKPVVEPRKLTIQEAKHLGSRLNGSSYTDTAHLQSLKRAAQAQHLQTQVQSEAIRQANLRHPSRRLDPKVQERLTKSPPRVGQSPRLKSQTRLTNRSSQQLMSGQIRSSQQLTSGQIDSLVDKLYCLPKAAAVSTDVNRTKKSESRVEEIVESMLCENESQQCEVFHEEIDDYLLRLKVTHTPRSETAFPFKREHIQLRRGVPTLKTKARQASPARLAATALTSRARQPSPGRLGAPAQTSKAARLHSPVRDAAPVLTARARYASPVRLKQNTQSASDQSTARTTYHAASPHEGSSFPYSTYISQPSLISKASKQAPRQQRMSAEHVRP